MSEQIAAPQPFNVGRRTVLKTLTVAGAAGVGFASGVVAWPAFAADAPDWPQDAFKQKNLQDTLKALYGKDFEPSDKIALDVPEIAENGAVVPVSVKSSLAGVTSLAILVPENPFTLITYYKIPPGTEPAVACRIKMAKTSKVIAVVESGGKVYGASKDVKVTLGGCGG